MVVPTFVIEPEAVRALPKAGDDAVILVLEGSKFGAIGLKMSPLAIAQLLNALKASDELTLDLLRARPGGATN